MLGQADGREANLSVFLGIKNALEYSIPVAYERTITAKA